LKKSGVFLILIMPLYLYENEETGEVIEVLQGMNELHEYHGTNGKEKGLWRRVYVNPTLSFDTQVDAFNQKSFVNSTANKNDTYGDLFERSAEASAKRTEQYGNITLNTIKKQTVNCTQSNKKKSLKKL
jgi:hypothetical protein